MGFIERVDRGLDGLEAVSTGVCPGCETCRDSFDDYRVADELEGYRVPAHDKDCAEPIYFRTEEAATFFAEMLFENAWSCGEVYEESHFSGGGCDICGSPLGGDFESWHAIVKETGELIHGERACWDCINYLANGEVPFEDE